ncbi:DEAD/DEAH box helicase [Idiomarina sp. PL1-037]|uniref:DEAD/DEAH box helicase n=1 Tax=Idiomarina sp. PL1-037 TaxID=3095365 RepID=UPI002ACC2DF3|nr:DEAD/DEAH box helicase [Idiomarina sp. PL1-037]WQC52090.1 DEAD/DEAH box helicase [Idiomarina sp. PL1-037]
MNDIFEKMHEINDSILTGSMQDARNKVIKILAELETNKQEFPEPLNHFIRSVGLYPYINLDKASWQERFVHESFKVDVGDGEAALHRDQSLLLKKLLQKNDIAVSAPTSFGKSFVIDSFISIQKPKNVVIIVPTIALTDETRRRLQRKFGDIYKIITTTDVELADRNILIFPQERAASYLSEISEIDILIVDEFYKASKEHDKERSTSLLRAILKLSKISKQRYFLAPNIKQLKQSIFTDGMEFLELDFNTVFLEKHNKYLNIDGQEHSKSDELLEILKYKNGKTLIYAGTYSGINEVANLIIDSSAVKESQLLVDFSNWLSKNYERNWTLTNLVKRGCGVHNGRLHRSLSQLQVKLFEEDDGINRLISTSSIIEGVNTSAENVIIWRNKNGNAKLRDFTYKNIIGRGGRMFRHFIGNVYLLEPPPKEEESELELEFNQDLASSVDETEYSQQLTADQIAKIIAYKEEMTEMLGEESFKKLQSDESFGDFDSSIILKVSRALSDNPENYKSLGFLNSNNPENWGWSLYKALETVPGYIGAPYTKFVEFIKCISNNWNHSFPNLLDELSKFDIGIDDFFDLERKATFKLSTLLNEINIIQMELFPTNNVDISPFIAKVGYAFLPPNIYKLEEYGLPRMISKKIHESGYIDLKDEEKPIHDILDDFRRAGVEKILTCSDSLDSFDKYIINHFFEGIMVRK